MKKKVILLGTKELLGYGSEFPRIAIDCKYVPKELHPTKWNKFREEVKYDRKIISKEFKKISKLYGYDSNLPDVAEFRKGKGWTDILRNRVKSKCEIIVPKLSGESLFTLSYNLVGGITNGESMLDFEDSAAILFLPPTDRDIFFRARKDSDKMENITLWNYALMLSRWKDHIESRLGNFFYIHLDDYPKEFYDPKNNPLLYHLKEDLLFEDSLYSLIPEKINKRLYDGEHLDGIGHLYLEEYFYRHLKENGHGNLFS